MDQTGQGRPTGNNNASGTPDDMGEMSGGPRAARVVGKVDDVATRAHEKIDRLSESARPAVDRVSAGAHELVESAATKASDVAERIDDKAAALRERQERLTDQVTNYVKDNPLASVGIAVATGFILAKMLGG